MQSLQHADLYTALAFGKGTKQGVFFASPECTIRRRRPATRRSFVFHSIQRTCGLDSDSIRVKKNGRIASWHVNEVANAFEKRWGHTVNAKALTLTCTTVNVLQRSPAFRRRRHARRMRVHLPPVFGLRTARALSFLRNPSVLNCK